MTIELKPYGTACNLNCSYCYWPKREPAGTPDIDKMISVAKPLGPKFSLFGGEPLLTPKPMLEKLFQAGCTGMQTNGVLIDDEHIALFKKYNVGIGVSVDGPADLNTPRCDVNTTVTVFDNIGKMRKAGIAVSIISVLHRKNVGYLALPEFLRFGSSMACLGIPNINCHFLQGDHPDALSSVEESAAFIQIAEWLRDRPQLRWQPFLDIVGLLQGKAANTLCVWRGCDPYSTTAVHSIEADGSVTNCGRLGGTLKASDIGAQRQEILAQADCKGCRFFPLCKGGCPGEAVNGDWRNKSSHCGTIRNLFRFYEDLLLDQGITPESVKPSSSCCPTPVAVNVPHGDVPYQDRPHGDHTDHAAY